MGQTVLRHGTHWVHEFLPTQDDRSTVYANIARMTHKMYTAKGLVQIPLAWQFSLDGQKKLFDEKSKDGSWNWGGFAHTEQIAAYHHSGTFLKFILEHSLKINLEKGLVGCQLPMLFIGRKAQIPGNVLQNKIDTSVTFVCFFFVCFFLFMIEGNN